jgi:hypothetical protein
MSGLRLILGELNQAADGLLEKLGTAQALTQANRSDIARLQGDLEAAANAQAALQQQMSGMMEAVGQLSTASARAFGAVGLRTADGTPSQGGMTDSLNVILQQLQVAKSRT